MEGQNEVALREHGDLSNFLKTIGNSLDPEYNEKFPVKR